MNPLTYANKSLPTKISDTKNWIDVIHFQAKKHPTKVAFSFLASGESISQEISYFELNSQAKSLAVKILQSAKTGDRAMLLMPNGIDYIVGFFACLYAGVIAITAYPPLHKKRDWGRINSLLSDSDPSIVLSDQKHKEKIAYWVEENAPSCHLIEVVDQYENLELQWEFPDINDESIAYLQYSSGSTGSPKGVMLSHKNLLHNVRLSCRVYGVKPDDSIVSWLPMYHDMGLIGSVLNPLYNGSPAWLLPPAIVLQKPFLWLKALSDYQAKFSAGPNFIYEHCVNRITQEQKDTLDLSSWRCSINGAEPIAHKTLCDFNAAFGVCGLSEMTLTPSYGMAETSLFVTAIATEDKFSVVGVNKNKLLHGQAVVSDNGISVVSSGVINDEMEVKIVNPVTLTAMPNSHVGEIWIKGDSVSSGYWNKTKATRAAFNFSLTDSDGFVQSGFLRSGDLGFIRDNHLYICGRSKEVIIVHGRNHFPQDIEASVQTVDSVLSAHGGAAFSVDEHNARQKIIVVQELSRHGLKRKDHDDIILSIRQAVAEAHEISLSAVLLIAPMSLAKTTSGKIQRVTSREQYLNGTLNVISQWHKDLAPNHDANSHAYELLTQQEPPAMTVGNQESIQQWIMFWIAKRLQIPLTSLRAEQELSSTGLDSVDGMMLVHELSERLGHTLSAELVWQYPTIAKLSAYLAQPPVSSDENESILEGEI